MISLRILMVTQPTSGGVAKWVIDVGAALVKQGHLITVASPRSDDESFEQACTREGLSVLTLPMEREIRPFADSKALLGLIRILRSQQYDLVHGHSSKAGMLARVAGALMGVPVVFTPHAWSFYAALGIKRRLFTGLEGLAGRFTDCLIGCSADEVDTATKLNLISPERCVYIPNGVNLDVIDRIIPIDRGLLGLSEDDFVLGTVARLAPQKGIHNLLLALAQLQPREKVRLVVVGDGPQVTELKELAASLGLDNVVWAGWKADPVAHLKAFDVFVLPSLWEGLPYALLEAMAVGLPCVATSVGGNVEVLQPGAGVLCRPDSSQDLARALSDCINQSPEQRAALGRAARRRVAERYSFSGQVDAITQAYGALRRKA